MANARDALWETGHDESVEVNQRALIDKVLARYSGEFTVFRELLQNSDDAMSKSVEIHFETQAYLDRKSGKEGALPERFDVDGKPILPDLKKANVHQWTFKNDGILFREEDWSRLKKIAEGNPDEEKIGAFGVGFYSLFSVTEEPFVTSGDKWMGFYWKDKKDQLFARRGTLPEESSSAWTAFEMTLREPAPIPTAFDFTRFLTSSITFMRHLTSVSVFFDDKRLARITKEPGAVAKPFVIPPGLKGRSPENAMSVRKIFSTPLHIKAEVMRWVYTSGTEKPYVPPPPPPSNEPVKSGFFSLFGFGSSSSASTPQAVTPPPPPPKKVDRMEITESSVVLSIFTAEVDVLLNAKIETELHRSTKKKPPRKLNVDLIYTGKDEYDASKKDDDLINEATGSIFQGLRADLDGTSSTRVFIGHATGQTTGIGGHLSARFIPTVERESIDLMDRHVAIWNKELLYVGGFLARCAFNIEMARIRKLWEAAAESAGPTGTVDPEVQTWLIACSLHALKFFTFYPSTPSSVVSHLMETAFFSCSADANFSLLSTAGMTSATDVRMPDPMFGFLKQLPVIPPEVLSGAKRMVETLRARGMLKDITFVDVLKELKARPLNETEMLSCLQWWIRVVTAGTATTTTYNLSEIRTEVLNSAVLVMGTPGGKDERLVPLSAIKTFVGPKNRFGFPLDGPVPQHVLPFSVSKTFSIADLTQAFYWSELSVLGWLKNLVTTPDIDVQYDMRASPAWSEQVLNIISKSWATISKVEQAEIITLLKAVTCIPTRAGMKTPGDAYFPNVNIFPDLPTLSFPRGSAIRGSLDEILGQLGVRRHVELQIIFDRMIKTGDWTINDLTKYLASVQSTLTPQELDRLTKTAVFAREGDDPAMGKGEKKRFRADELYEPVDMFRRLGLPVINWGAQNKWRSASDEARFLFTLGLKRQPPLETLLDLAAGPDAMARAIALEYFFKNATEKYPAYHPTKFQDLAFIPAIHKGSNVMCKPNEVYVEPEAALFGLPIVHPTIKDEAVSKLHLEPKPSPDRLVRLLERAPPKDIETARRWFEALSSRISDFSAAQIDQLRNMKFIPDFTDEKTLRMLSPSTCHIGGAETEGNFHSKLFLFVDFGPRANNFLSACGCKPRPSVDEIAEQLIADPKRFYTLAAGRENFLGELRNLAVNYFQLSYNVRAKLQKAPVLSASRRVKLGSSVKEGQDFDEDEWDYQFQLMIAPGILVADSTSTYQVFGDVIWVAPQEDILEEFYIRLGAQRLSAAVKENYKTSAEVESKHSSEIRSLVLERLPLFLYEHTHATLKVKYDWLNSDKNFKVKTFGKIMVHRILKTRDSFGTTRVQEASAVARRDGFMNTAPIELWLAANAQIDMYEVATALCKVLFDSPKANDALLFMTILSTDLRSLKRRGYNVDRILRQQRATRMAAEEEARARERERQAQAKREAQRAEEMDRDLGPPPLPGMKPGDPLPPGYSPMPEAGHLEGQLPPPMSPNGLEGFGNTPPSRDNRSMFRAFRDLRHRLTNRVSQSHIAVNGVGPQDVKAVATADNFTDSPEAAQPVVRAPPPTTRHLPPSTVTPMNAIDMNVSMAISACRSESGKTVRSKETMELVKEAQDGYCDVSGRVDDLHHVGEIGDIKIYATKGVAKRDEFIMNNRDVLIRFINIIIPLRDIYGLAKTSINIFSDVSGGLVAFNRNASLFLNLRYYEGWHDQDVLRGDLSKALISWYFTLAHEIAHNLVHAHNSEHEFYFSAICESYMMSFRRLLDGPAAPVTPTPSISTLLPVPPT